MHEITYNGHTIRSTYPADTVRAALRLYARGHSAKHTAARLGVSDNCVNRWASAAGIKRTLSEAMQLARSPEEHPDYDRCIELYDAGLSGAQVEELTAVPESTVQNWVRQIGLVRTYSEAHALRYSGPHAAGRARRRLIREVGREAAVGRYTVEQIARRHGLGETTVRSYIDSEHNPYRRRGPA